MKPTLSITERERLLKLARAASLERSAAKIPPIVPVDRTGPLPLSFAQERLWFLHQMEPEGTGYNMPWPRRLRGRLDARALERALGELVRRHEALRTTFRHGGAGRRADRPPGRARASARVDLAGLAPEDREHEARRLAREDAERPFDLERGPLLRAALLRLADDEHVLLLNVHHIVSDGWSMGVLFRELFTLYESLAGPPMRRDRSPLPPLAVQYADFAVWQRGWLQGEVLQRQLDWWRERLGGAPPALELPTDRPRPAWRARAARSHAFRIPADVTRGLRALARREGATLYMVTHAALDLLLSRWSGQEDLVVGVADRGTHAAGDGGADRLLRQHARAAHRPLRRPVVPGAPAPRAGDGAGGIRAPGPALRAAGGGGRSGPGAVAHAALPGDVRAAERGLRREAPGHRRAAAGAVRGRDPDGALRPGAGPHGVGEELFGSLRFRTDLFDAATMERFAAQYRALLAAGRRLAGGAPVAPGAPARGGGADAPGVRERSRPRGRGRRPGAPPVRGAGRPHARRARRPVRGGVAHLRASWTRAPAAWRGSFGAAASGGDHGRRVPGARHGLVVAPLAVWKAGGVYLPLDPGYPAERLSFLLRDSGASPC